MADLILDGKMLEVARQAALKLAAYDPFLEKPQYALLRERVNSTLVKVTSVVTA